MKTRLSFIEFKKSLLNHDIPLKDLANYLEWDSNFKLKFTKDAFIDTQPIDIDIDIDTAVHELLQKLDDDNYEINNLKVLDDEYYDDYDDDDYRSFDDLHPVFGRKRIVVEGDSWMNLPMILGWEAIGDALKSRGNYNVRNIGKWGHTMQEMYDNRNKRNGYMKVLKKKKPDYFIFSGGGNDIQDKLKEKKTMRIIKQYDPKLSADDYINKDGKQALREIEDLYKKMLTEVTSNFPDMKIFTFSYDYPRPEEFEHGKFIGQYLKKRKIPRHMWQSIIKNLMHKLDKKIYSATQPFNNVYHINCFGTTKEYRHWRNDFHPKNNGYRALAKKFENAIKGVEKKDLS